MDFGGDSSNAVGIDFDDIVAASFRLKGSWKDTMLGHFNKTVVNLEFCSAFQELVFSCALA